MVNEYVYEMNLAKSMYDCQSKFKSNCLKSSLNFAASRASLSLDILQFLQSTLSGMFRTCTLERTSLK